MCKFDMGILLLVFLSIICQGSGKIGFKKDLSMDAVFPAPIRRDAGLPEGHLRPLGYQRPAEGPVDELKGFPDIRVFYYGYSKQRTPVVFREALNDQEVFHNWKNDKYLKDKFGRLNLTVVSQRPIFHRDEMKRTTQTMKLKKFLGDYEYDDWYISSIIPQEIQQQLSLPPLLQCGVVSRYLQAVMLWMSSGSLSSTLHNHHDHNLQCVLFGRKDYVVIDHRYRYNFDYKETYPNSGEGYSPIDMENINVFKHKQVSGTPWTWATLEQGDCILIPSGYMHYVHAYGRCVSYSVLFSPTSDVDENVDEPPCKKDSNKMKMSDATFLWSFDGGKARLTNKKLDTEAVRHHLFSLLRDDHEMYFEKFEHFYNKTISGAKKFPDGQKVFDILKKNIVNPEKREDKDDKGLNYVTRVDLHQLRTDQLQRLAEIFNDPASAMKNHVHSHEEL